MNLDNLNQREAVEHLKKIGLWSKCLIRNDGRIELGCEHGVGHTIWAPKTMGKAGYTHGCDGCCGKFHLGVDDEDRN